MTLNDPVKTRLDNKGGLNVIKVTLKQRIGYVAPKTV